MSTIWNPNWGMPNLLPVTPVSLSSLPFCHPSLSLCAPHPSVPSLCSSILPPSVPLPPLCPSVSPSLSPSLYSSSLSLSSCPPPLSLCPSSLSLCPPPVSPLSPLSAPGSLPLYAPSFSTMSLSLPFLCLTLSLLSVPLFFPWCPCFAVLLSLLPPPTPLSSSVSHYYSWNLPHALKLVESLFSLLPSCEVGAGFGGTRPEGQVMENGKHFQGHYPLRSQS